VEKIKKLIFILLASLFIFFLVFLIRLKTLHNLTIDSLKQTVEAPYHELLVSRQIKDMSLEEKLDLIFLFGAGDQLQTFKNTNLIAIDQEGGMVARIKAPEIDNTAQAEIESEEQAYQVAVNRAQILKDNGINTNFAPVIEVNREEDSYLANLQRAFPGDEQNVYRLAKAMIKGYQENGILCVLKHFPGGLGRKSADPHQTLPVININQAQLEQDLIPFKQLIKTRKAKAIMTTHLLYPQIDSNNPVTTSNKFVSQILRDDLGFRGVIVSDDLTMKGISSNDTVEQVAISAIKAGHDMLIIVGPESLQQSSYQTLLQAVQAGEIDEVRINKSVKRILLLQFLISN
jgi:beta-N-acetylhexosaminidase